MFLNISTKKVSKEIAELGEIVKNQWFELIFIF